MLQVYSLSQYQFRIKVQFKVNYKRLEEYSTINVFFRKESQIRFRVIAKKKKTVKRQKGVDPQK